MTSSAMYWNAVVPAMRPKTMMSSGELPMRRLLRLLEALHLTRVRDRRMVKTRHFSIGF